MKMLNYIALLALALFNVGCASLEREIRSPEENSPKALEELAKQGTQRFFENTRQGPR